MGLLRMAQGRKSSHFRFGGVERALFHVKCGDSSMVIETDRTHIIIDYDENSRLMIHTSKPDSSGCSCVVYQLEASDGGEDVDESTEGTG